MTDDERFLDRWSRRKATAQTETENAVPVPAAPETTPAPPAATPNTPPVDPETLPDIDSMDADSDFTVFMQDGVPEALRNRALRKLWMSDPAFNVADGLVEYGDDYSTITTIAETVQSAYKVGKGIVDETKTDGLIDTSEEIDPVEQANADLPDKAADRQDTETDVDLFDYKSSATVKDDTK